jgi:1,4-dihydroxy-2-naphthoate octaprenyltransferase
MTVFANLFRTIRPLFLFSVFLLYSLGVGMARYTGTIINLDLVLLGGLWLLALQLSGLYLHDYFGNSEGSTLNGEKDSLAHQIRLARLLIAYSLLTAVASLSVMLIRSVDTPVVFILMLVMVCGTLGYSLPPFRLEYSGYGELLLSLLVANLTPALGFQLQGGDSLRLLAMVTFPLTAMHLAMLLAHSLSSYAGDLKYSHRTLMLRMGWQYGILLHNILILFSYLLLMLAITFGLAWQVGVPALLTMPIGILQIITVNRIAAGARPPWKALKVLGAGLFGITAYLLTYGFWIR